MVYSIYGFFYGKTLSKKQLVLDFWLYNNSEIVNKRKHITNHLFFFRHLVEKLHFKEYLTAIFIKYNVHHEMTRKKIILDGS